MGENMMNAGHKASTEKSRKNYNTTFGPRCEYHGGRKGVLQVWQNIWLCEECASSKAVGE